MTEKQAYKEIDDLYMQLRAIELNPASYLGGLKAYSSEYSFTHTLRAEKKIKTIKAKIAHFEQFITEV
jgi:hypothetical protein